MQSYAHAPTLSTNDAGAILDAIESVVRNPRRQGADRIDFYCDLEHRTRTAHARAWIDDDGNVGVCCFNDAGHNRPLWELLVKPNLAPRPSQVVTRPDGSCVNCNLFNGAHHPICPQAYFRLAENQREARRQRCEGWDRIVAGTAKSMGLPIPFPTEPPPNTWLEFLRQTDYLRTIPEPQLRMDFLPEWAQRAMAAAGLTTPGGLGVDSGHGGSRR